MKQPPWTGSVTKSKRRIRHGCIYYQHQLIPSRVRATPSVDLGYVPVPLDCDYRTVQSSTRHSSLVTRHPPAAKASEHSTEPVPASGSYQVVFCP